MLLHQKLHQRHNQQALTCTESQSVSTERAAWSRSGNETGDLDQLDLKLHPMWLTRPRSLYVFCTLSNNEIPWEQDFKIIRIPMPIIKHVEHELKQTELPLTPPPLKKWRKGRQTTHFQFKRDKALAYWSAGFKSARVIRVKCPQTTMLLISWKIY